MTTIHENNPDYFRRKRGASKTALERMYWGIRLNRSLKLERQLQERAKTAAKLKQREDNLNSFENLDTPQVELKSMHPNGCIVAWHKPAKWEPDTYMVLVRGSPLEDWRSVASSNITRDTRSQVLTKSYLSWGAYKEPYYICVAAVKNGVGRKESKTVMYPPDYKMQKLEVEPQVVFVPDKTPEKPQPELVDTNPFEARHEVIDRPASETRAQTIIHHLRTFAGRRTRKGRPYISDFREVCVLNPKVKYSELRKLWKQLDNAETGEEKWR